MQFGTGVMEKRHMDIITQRAEEFAQTGVTRFKRWELKSWYGAERLGKNVWRSIDEHIRDKSPRAKIKVIEVDNEFIIMNSNQVHEFGTWI